MGDHTGPIAPAPLVQVPPRLSRGLGWWIRSYMLMLRFEGSTQRSWLPFAVIMQVLLGAGMAIIYGFYVPHLPRTAALYLVTGAPTLSLIPVGLLALPNLVGQQQTAGTFDFMWSLPVPRAASVASTLTIISIVSIPGVVVALLIAAWRYGVDLAISPSIVPAFLLTSLMAASVGLGLAHAIGKPVVTNLVTNILIFVVLLFSPIAFPKSQFPTWLANVHEVLPLYHMGVVVRAGLTKGLVTDVGSSYALLTAWTVVGWLATAWVVGRRR